MTDQKPAHNRRDKPMKMAAGATEIGLGDGEDIASILHRFDQRGEGKDVAYAFVTGVRLYRNQVLDAMPLDEQVAQIGAWLEADAAAYHQMTDYLCGELSPSGRPEAADVAAEQDEYDRTGVETSTSYDTLAVALHQIEGGPQPTHKGHTDCAAYGISAEPLSAAEAVSIIMADPDWSRTNLGTLNRDAMCELLTEGGAEARLMGCGGLTFHAAGQGPSEAVPATKVWTEPTALQERAGRHHLHRKVTELPRRLPLQRPKNGWGPDPGNVIRSPLMPMVAYRQRQICPSL